MNVPLQNRIRMLADALIKECQKEKPGDIGGRLQARSVAEQAIDKAAKRLESDFVDDYFEG